MNESLQPEEKRHRLLYPTMLVAAFSVIVFSVLGIATMTGVLPSARSHNEPVAAEAQPSQRAPAPGQQRLAAADAPTHAHKSAVPERRADARPAPRREAAQPPVARACAECGVVASVRTLQRQGEGSMVGAGAGALLGGLLGHQIGKGNGQTVATVAGAGAGAFAGNEIERNMNRRTYYETKVRMSDGTLRSYTSSAPPGVRSGQPVRVVDGRLVAD